jgi:hypothetical protein
MMLARFGAAGLLTDQQSLSLGCDATTCDHQHSQCRQCVTQMKQQVQNSCDTLLMMLARFGAAGLLTDQQSTCCLGCDATTINIASAGSVLQ